MPSDHDSPRTTDPRSTTSSTPSSRMALRRALTGTAVAALAAGALAGSAAAGRTGEEPDTAAAALAAAASRQTPALLGDGGRGSTTSRSSSGGAADPAKVALLAGAARSGGQVTRTEELGGGDPRAIAQALMGRFGFGSDQFSCLDALWEKESGWDPAADNPTSSAFGIPQALPGSKMASAGADWATNPATQIEWGLGYIRDTYGSPCSAWGHSQANNWY